MRIITIPDMSDGELRTFILESFGNNHSWQLKIVNERRILLFPKEESSYAFVVGDGKIYTNMPIEKMVVLLSRAEKIGGQITLQKQTITLIEAEKQIEDTLLIRR